MMRNTNLLSDKFFRDNFFISSFGRRFYQDPFFSSEINPLPFYDLDKEFETFGMENFCIDKDLYKLGSLGNNCRENSYISRSFVNTTSNGSDQPTKEYYNVESYLTTDENGKKIGESKTSYENTAKGIRKASHQKLLGERGYREVHEKEINKDESNVRRIYNNLTDQELESFEKEFNDHKQKISVGSLKDDDSNRIQDKTKENKYLNN
jgi:hypothetical protein